MGLDKETRQRKRSRRELDDESSTIESPKLDESSVSIKGEIRSESTELELTFDFSNLAERLPFGRRCTGLLRSRAMTLEVLALRGGGTADGAGCCFDLTGERR